MAVDSGSWFMRMMARRKENVEAALVKSLTRQESWGREGDHMYRRKEKVSNRSI